VSAQGWSEGGNGLQKSIKGGLAITGGLNLGGSIETIFNPVAVVETAIEKGAASILMPINGVHSDQRLPLNKGQINGESGAMPDARSVAGSAATPSHVTRVQEPNEGHFNRREGL
jgi:hypothetical protein